MHHTVRGDDGVLVLYPALLMSKRVPLHATISLLYTRPSFEQRFVISVMTRALGGLGGGQTRGRPRAGELYMRFIRHARIEHCTHTAQEKARGRERAPGKGPLSLPLARDVKPAYASS